MVESGVKHHNHYPCFLSAIGHIDGAIYLQLISTENINQLKDELRFKTV